MDELALFRVLVLDVFDYVHACLTNEGDKVVELLLDQGNADDINYNALTRANKELKQHMRESTHLHSSR